MRIFAENFRGFSVVELDLAKMSFLVGDNSSGKTSLLHLVDCVSRSNLNFAPRLNDDLGVSPYDYFSPYFDFKDVTFGFVDDDDGGVYAKLITVRYRKNGTPRVMRCSYFIDDLHVTIKQSAKKSYVKVVRDTPFTSAQSAIFEHSVDRGFQEKKKLPSGTSLCDASALFFLTDDKEIERGLIFQKVFREEMPSPRLISPIRALPERFYSFSRKISPFGSHFASMWHDFHAKDKTGLFKEAELFGREGKLFDQMRVRAISEKISDSPLVVTVQKHGKQLFMNQVGVGVSQIVPVLIEVIFAMSLKEKLPVLIQQPELHLHPVAQAALGTFLYRAWQAGLNGILETHSSHLIDRFRAELREGGGASSIEPTARPTSDIAIIFCENGPSGNFAHQVHVDQSGRLVGEPDAYHAFFVDELQRTMF